MHRFSGARNRGIAERVVRHYFRLELLVAVQNLGLQLSRPTSSDRFHVPAADIKLLQISVGLACLSVHAAGLSRFFV